MADVALIALGSNLGARAAHLASARSAIALLPGTTLLAASAVEETAPFGETPQGPYLNQMIAIRTALPARTLLDALHAIERRQGRVRRVRWGPRTLDLDLVRYGALVSAGRSLRLPHPGLSDRGFWQREEAELRRRLADVA